MLGAITADVPAPLAPQHTQSLRLTDNGTAGAARVERAVASSELNFNTADWTVSGWFKRTNTSTIDSILQLGESGGWGNNSLSLVLPDVSNSIELRNFAGTVQNVGIIKTGVGTGAWHHFAIVRDTTTLRFYMNGTLAGSDNDFSFTFDPAKPLKLGCVSTSTGVWDSWLNGGLADFGVFSAALPAAGVTCLASRPIANLAGQSATNTVSLTIQRRIHCLVDPGLQPARRKRTHPHRRRPQWSGLRRRI